LCLFEFVLAVGECVSVIETQIFSWSGEGISVNLYSALEKSFARVLRRVVVGGFYVWACGVTCVWGGVYWFQDFEGCFLQDGCDFRVCRVCEGLWEIFFLEVGRAISGWRV